MKITGGTQGSIERVTTTQVQQKTSKSDAASTRSTSAGTATQVQVSNIGKKLAAARAPEVPDESRIEQMKGLISSGKLSVDPHAIATAMLRDER